MHFGELLCNVFYAPSLQHEKKIPTIYFTQNLLCTKGVDVDSNYILCD